jgi:hypothetical protein
MDYTIANNRFANKSPQLPKSAARSGFGNHTIDLNRRLILAPSFLIMGIGVF